METSSSDELATLVFAEGKIYNLKTGQYLVGNALSKEFAHDVVIDDPSVDIKHAAIIVTHETIKLVDLFSQHGTYVGGKKVKQLEVIELSKSAKLQFGSVICHFRNNQESDSGFLALNDSTGKDISIIPNTPTYTNQSHKNRSTTSTSSPSVLQNADECDESFLVKATQPFNEHALKNNTSVSARYITSLLEEDDDDFFIPETQVAATENLKDQLDDSCDMFQLNTQDFNDGDDCSNHSDNLITNLSHQVSMPIPFVHANEEKNEKDSNIIDGQMRNVGDSFENDTDCEEELFHLKLDETDKSTNFGDKLGSSISFKGVDGAMEDAEDLEPTQMLPEDIHKENDAQNSLNKVDDLEATEAFSPNQKTNVVDEARSSHSDNEDDIPATQAFPFPNALRGSNKSDTPKADLSKSHTFAVPKFGPRKSNTSFTVKNAIQDVEATQIFPPRVQTTEMNKKISPPKNKENHSFDESIEATQVFKIPAKVSTSGDDLNYMEATQKFIVPSPLSTKKQRSPSPVLLDSDEDDHNPEFCLADTLVAGETPKPIPAAMKKATPDKRKSKLNKLFGSDDEDEDDDDSNILNASPITPNANVPIISLLQPTPDFAFIKLPNLKKIGLADEIFRKKSREMERQKTLLEESSDDEDDPTKVMDRLLAKSETLAAAIKDSPVEQSDGESTRSMHSPKKIDDNSKRAKRSVRKTSSKSNANEPETKSHSKGSRVSRKKTIKEEDEEKESSSRKQTKDRESPSRHSSTSKSSEKSKSTSTSSSRRTAKNSNAGKDESKSLPEKKSTRQRSERDENKPEKLSRRAGGKSKEDKHDRNAGSRNTRQEFYETSDKKFPGNKLGELKCSVDSYKTIRDCKVLLNRAVLIHIPENVEHPSNKRHNSSKDESTVPKKRSKENDPSLVEPVINEEITSLRKSNRTTKQRIIFTKMDSRPYEALIEKIGGTIVDSPNDCTVLITDSIYRTWKLLSALGKGVPIVSAKWLEDSSTSKQWKHEPPKCDDYLIRDIDSERRYKFTLKKSLERARHSPVFKRYSFYCTPNTRPVPKELQTIIECAGGKLIKKIHKTMEKPEKFYIVSDKSDTCMWPDIRKLVGNVQIVSTEGILIAVMQQCVNFKAYLLAE